MIYELIFYGILFIVMFAIAGAVWKQLPIGWKTFIKKVLKFYLKKLGFYKQK